MFFTCHACNDSVNSKPLQDSVQHWVLPTVLSILCSTTWILADAIIHDCTQQLSSGTIKLEMRQCIHCGGTHWTCLYTATKIILLLTLNIITKPAILCSMGPTCTGMVD